MTVLEERGSRRVRGPHAGWALLTVLALVPAQGRAAGLVHPPFGYSVRGWQTNHGLPQSSVYAISQTPDGYLWVGTDAGLARYDGFRFTPISQAVDSRGVDIARIRALRTDHRGALWIGAAGGDLLARLDGNGLLSLRSRIPFGGSLDVAFEDSAKRWWLGGAKGLARWSQRGEVQAVLGLDGASPQGVQAIAEGPDRRIWVGTRAGLHVIREDGVLSPPMAGGPSRVRALAYDSSRDQLWIGSEHGLFRSSQPAGGATALRLQLHPHPHPHPHRFGLADGLPSEIISTLLLARRGALWVGTSQGIARLDPGAARFVMARAGPLRDSVLSAFQDREGNVWFGTRSRGLHRMRRNRVISLGVPQGLPAELVTAVHEGPSGVLWVGTDGGGLARISEGRIRTYTRADGLCVEAVLTLREDRRGVLWVGGRGEGVNLCRLRNDRFETFSESQGLPAGQVVRSVFESGDGVIWVGTSGLLRVPEERASAGQEVKAVGPKGGVRLVREPLPGADASEPPEVIVVREDRSGTLWLGTSNGLWRRTRAGGWTRFDERHGLSAGRIGSIFEDAEGTLWLGTISGLSRRTGETFESLREEQGLFDDPVFHVAQDRQGYLWLSSPRGLFRLRSSDLGGARKKPADRVAFVRFGTADGMNTDHCEGGEGDSAGTTSRNGHLWFATSRGVATVDPSALELNPLPPPVMIEQFIVDGRLLSWGPGRDPSVPGEVASGSRSIDIRYTSTSLSAAERVRFRYRLDPLEKDWTEVGTTRRRARYAHLPAGTYRFRVTASNNDGVWNEAGASLSFRILPRFYEQRWFHAALALGILGLIVGFHRLRVGQLNARHTSVLRERTRIAREMHDTLAQAFTGISMHLEVAVKRFKEGSDKALVSLNEARLQARLGLAEARRAVWGLRLDVPRGGDVRAALHALAAHFPPDVPVRVEVGGQVRPLPENLETALLRVAQEGLSNALKHAGAREVLLDLLYHGDAVELRVRDDGQGFDVAERSTQQGHFGLLGIRERAEALNGTFVVNSRPGEGTELVFRVSTPPQN